MKRDKVKLFFYNRAYFIENIKPSVVLSVRSFHTALLFYMENVEGGQIWSLYATVIWIHKNELESSVSMLH